MGWPELRAASGGFWPVQCGRAKRKRFCPDPHRHLWTSWVCLPAQQPALRTHLLPLGRLLAQVVGQAMRGPTLPLWSQGPGLGGSSPPEGRPGGNGLGLGLGVALQPSLLLHCQGQQCPLGSPHLRVLPTTKAQRPDGASASARGIVPHHAGACSQASVPSAGGSSGPMPSSAPAHSSLSLGAAQAGASGRTGRAERGAGAMCDKQPYCRTLAPAGFLRPRSPLASPGSIGLRVTCPHSTTSFTWCSGQ